MGPPIAQQDVGVCREEPVMSYLVVRGG